MPGRRRERDADARGPRTAGRDARPDAGAGAGVSYLLEHPSERKRLATAAARLIGRIVTAPHGGRLGVRGLTKPEHDTLFYLVSGGLAECVAVGRHSYAQLTHRGMSAAAELREQLQAKPLSRVHTPIGRRPQRA